MEDNNTEDDASYAYASGEEETYKEEEKGPLSSSTVNQDVLKERRVNSDYMSLSLEDLRLLQTIVIREVSEILNISEDHAAVLLLYFKWNKERLMDAFYEDPNATRRMAGAIQGQHVCIGVPTSSSKTVVAPPSSSRKARKPDSPKAPPCLNNTFMCPVLFEQVPLSETLSMGCEPPGEAEHRVSLEAWRQYLIASSESDATACVKATCPVSGCKCVVSPRVWRIVLGGSLFGGNTKVALEKYERYLASNFVDINKTIKWCPTPGCSFAVQKLAGGVRAVKCDRCSGWFCFQCREEAHDPLSCAGFVAWAEKCAGESQTANWLIVNTKPCPNCGVTIEKNNGCNHMHCTRCKADWCWICAGRWDKHSSCNRFDEEKNRAPKDGTALLTARRDLDRYLHYFNRYQIHRQSLAFATKLRVHAEQRMTELQQKGGAGWIDVQFVSQAAEQLIDCRRVLSYTYALAYFLPDGPEKSLFEHNQVMLEGNTERLSEFTELDPMKMDRSQVVNYTTVTSSFLSKMLESTKDLHLVL